MSRVSLNRFIEIGFSTFTKLTSAESYSVESAPRTRYCRQLITDNCQQINIIQVLTCNEREREKIIISIENRNRRSIE